MSPPGTILLVSCYELGHQPLGLASPRGFLSAAGFATESLDLAVEPLDRARIARAWFVGISVPMHTALRLGVRVAGRVREIHPGAHICFYGLYAALNADYLLRHGADSVLGGEYEGALVELVSSLPADREARGDPGREKGAPHGHRARPAARVLERLAFQSPLRDALPPLERYARLQKDGQETLAGYVEASRGCLHRCLHCPIPPVYGGRFFVVPESVLREDIRRLVEAGARHITFGDPDFLNGPGHSLRIARWLHGEHPGLTFDVTTKVEHILERRELFPELARLGCLFVTSAIESLSDRVLERLEKGHTRADVMTALDILEAAGIPMRPSLLPFTPWSGLEDYLELVDFVSRRGLVYQVDPVQFSIRLLVPPGSSLLERAETREWLGPLDEGSLTYRWSHSDPRMDELHAAVSRVVEKAACAGEDAALTLARIRALATSALRGPWLAAGGPEPASLLPPESPFPVPPTRRRAPRLTESWFC